MPTLIRLTLLSLVSMCFSTLLTQESHAQRRGGFFRGGTGIELLFQDGVRDEIELVEEQEDELRDLGRSMQEDMRSVFGGLGDLPEEERREVMQSRMREVQETAKERLNKILLPHQLERLKQLQLQSRMQRSGAADALGSEELREKLGLTEDQLERMRETAEEAQSELREQIQKATQEAREKVLAVLTPEQRSIWDEMTGSSFVFEDRFRGRGRGGRGGGRFGRGGPGRGGPRRSE